MSSKPESRKMRPKKPQLLKPVETSAKRGTKSNIKSVYGIELNSETARKAIILSEIIGPPAAKKRRRK